MRTVRALVTLGVSAVLGLVLLLVLVRTPLIGGVGILFYRGVLLSLVAGAGIGVLLTLARRRLGLAEETIVAAVVTSLSVNLCFLVLLPVTIDRSNSVFLLSQIEAARDEGLTTDQLRGRFVDIYVGRMDQVGRRVVEQSASGNIVVSGGRIRLTPRGRAFLGWSRRLAILFRTDPRFVGLADPSRR